MYRTVISNVIEREKATTTVTREDGIMSGSPPPISCARSLSTSPDAVFIPEVRREKTMC